MNTQQLVIMVGHIARTENTWGEPSKALYDDLEALLGERPVNMRWGAHCLYIGMPNEVDISVGYRT